MFDLLVHRRKFLGFSFHSFLIGCARLMNGFRATKKKAHHKHAKKIKGVFHDFKILAFNFICRLQYTHKS